MIWQLIVRNILRNKKNSLVIFLLITLITALFFIGNSLIGQTNAGLKKTYIDSLTADVVIQKNSDMSMNLFGANSPVIDNYVTIPVLPAYDTILELISAENGIQRRTSQVSGRAVMEIPDLLKDDEPVLICGVEPESYFDCFPGISVEEGRFIQPGEYGAMITAERAERLEKETGTRPGIGVPLVFTSAGYIGFKIREVPLVGIYRYQNPGQFMNEIVIADPQTVRVLLSVQVATAPAAEDAPLLPIDVNAFFTEMDAVEEDPGEHPEEFTPEELGDFLSSFNTGTETEEPDAELSGGDWNFILLRLREGISPAVFIRNLNKRLTPFGVYASGWRTAAGTSAIMMLLVQTFFNIGGVLVSIAGIIVVINILLIAVFRRTREIGALRAMGASDSYIRLLIMGENCCIAFTGGIAGLAAGSAFLRLINAMNIEIPNALAASLLGGPVLHIGFFPSTALASFCIALFLGAAASIYPVETAVRIDPITAVQEG
ncbi:MAG: FtsX-like permease family protein [Spirochaetaceae bacterium]|jgi:ABC-type lipoprotein release transport system permease subunit|nr:FtsX-like permease family protein [Spirochaetaceae bacterium]